MARQRSVVAIRRHAFRESYERVRDVVYVCTCGVRFAHDTYLGRDAVAKIALEAHIDIENNADGADQDILTIYVIYDRPLDFPNHFVVREQIAQRDGTVKMGAATAYAALDQARDSLPPGLYKMPPDPNDDVKICEVWL